MAAKADIQGGTATRVTIGIGTAKRPADLIPHRRFLHVLAYNLTADGMSRDCHKCGVISSGTGSLGDRGCAISSRLFEVWLSFGRSNSMVFG